MHHSHCPMVAVGFISPTVTDSLRFTFISWEQTQISWTSSLDALRRRRPKEALLTIFSFWLEYTLCSLKLKVAFYLLSTSPSLELTECPFRVLLLAEVEYWLPPVKYCSWIHRRYILVPVKIIIHMAIQRKLSAKCAIFNPSELLILSVLFDIYW